MIFSSISIQFLYSRSKTPKHTISLAFLPRIHESRWMRKKYSIKMEYGLHMAPAKCQPSKGKMRVFTRHIYGVLNESTCLARQTMSLMPQISLLKKPRHWEKWLEHRDPHPRPHQPNQAT